MVRPSAGEPAATMRRCTPSGSSRSRTPSAQGSGSTMRIGTCSSRATAGHQAALHDHREHDDHDHDAVEPLGVGHVWRRAGSCRAGSAPRPSGRRRARRCARSRCSRAGIRHSPTRTRPDDERRAPRRGRARAPTRRPGRARRGRRSGRGRRRRRSRRGWPAPSGTRSISRLYGARSSPIRIPATKTARNPEPWASVATPNSEQRAGQRAQRIQPLAGQRHPAHEPQQRPAADDADRGADAHLQQRTRRPT